MGNQLTKRKDLTVEIIVNEENKFHKSKTPSELTGFERVKLIFEKDAFGEDSPEYRRILDSTALSFFAGVIVGGIGRSKYVKQEFQRTNQHTAFENHQEALKVYKNKYMVGFASGAWRLGWRMAAFSFLFMMSGTCLAAYRNKYSAFDHVFGGMVGGLLYKFKDGPKASIAGSVVGGCLGLFSGSMQYLVIRFAGLGSTTNDFYEWQKRILQEQEYKARSSVHKQRADPTAPEYFSWLSGSDRRDVLALHHDVLVGTDQKGLQNLEEPLKNPILELPEEEDVDNEENLEILIEPIKEQKEIKNESNSNLLLKK